MGFYKDWLPASREGRLLMSKNWLALIKIKGKLAWKMEEEVIADYEELVKAAEYEVSRPMKDRTAGTNTRLKEAFKKLVASMRDIKRRYFFSPPLTEADFIDLGLHPHDTTHTPIAAPTGQAIAEIGYVGVAQLLLRIKRIDSIQPDSRSNYGFKIFYGIFSLTDKPPATAKELYRSKFTRNKKFLFTFEPEDSAKRVYFCIRYENGKGQTGPWGPMVSAIIP